MGGWRAKGTRREREKKKRAESKCKRQKTLYLPLGLSYLAFYFEFTQENLYNPLEYNWANMQSCIDLGLLKAHHNRENTLQTVGEVPFNLF